MRMRRTIGLSLALLFASAPALAKEANPVHHHPQPGAKSKATEPAAATRKSHSRHRRASGSGKRAMHAAARHHEPAAQHTAQAGPPDRYIGPLRVIGTRQIGYAAWYGGRHLGRRTASGERLDAVHATAAHRSLPLHSLVRVTNLRNGRSVIATITDRGPVSHRLLIDVSPKAAAELDMMSTGIAEVAIEPVVKAASPPE